MVCLCWCISLLSNFYTFTFSVPCVFVNLGHHLGHLHRLAECQVWPCLSRNLIDATKKQTYTPNYGLSSMVSLAFKTHKDTDTQFIIYSGHTSWFRCCLFVNLRPNGEGEKGATLQFNTNYNSNEMKITCVKRQANDPLVQ